MAVTVPDKLIDIEWPLPPEFDWMGTLGLLGLLLIVIGLLWLMMRWGRHYLPGLKDIYSVRRLRKTLSGMDPHSEAFQQQAKSMAFEAHQILRKHLLTDSQLASHADLADRLEQFTYSNRQVSHETLRKQLVLLEGWLRKNWKTAYRIRPGGWIPLHDLRAKWRLKTQTVNSKNSVSEPDEMER